jgi:putative phosphoesterase
MKVMIVSDTHGAHGYLDEALEQIGKIDMFIHLGDILDGFDYIDATVDCEKHMIAGNGDFFSSLKRESEFMIGSKKVFITHGHKYLKGWGEGSTDGVVTEGRRRGVDIIMFGHTHMPFLEVHPDITALNPGSISWPRQPDKKSSFILMEIDEDKQVRYSIYYKNKKGGFALKAK